MFLESTMGLDGQDRINLWKANVAGEAALQEGKALEAHWRGRVAVNERLSRRGIAIRVIVTAAVVVALVALWIATA